MDLSTMRDTFRERCEGLAEGLSNAEIEVYLNRAYRYTVPHDVGGEMGEVFWELTTEVGKDTYPYPDWVLGPTMKSPWTRGQGKLDFYSVVTEPHVFEQFFKDRANDTWAILFYGKKAILNNTPETVFTITIPARGGPSEDLLAEGITHSIHAQAVVSAAAMEFLSELDEDVGVQRESVLYERWKNQLETFAQVRANSRRPRRSF